MKLCVFLLLPLVAGSGDQLVIQGVVNMGGIYFVRNFTSYAECGPLVSVTNAILTEAHRFSVLYGNRAVLHDSFKLGSVVIDSCGTDVIGLQRSAEFVEHKDSGFCFKQSFRLSNRSSASNVFLTNGFMTSGVAKNMNYLLQAFCMPLICSGCSSPEFDDPDLFKFLLRTYPSDKYQAQGLERLLYEFGWTHVSVLYEDTTYGQNLYQMLQNYVNQEQRVCITAAQPLFMETTPDWTSIHAMLNYTANGHLPRVFVVLSNYIRADELFEKLLLWDLAGKVQLVGSDGWSTQEADSKFNQLLSNAITTEVAVNEFPAFDRHLRALNLSTVTQLRNGFPTNPWIAAVIESQHNCSLNRNCNGSETLLSADFASASRKARLVFRSVYIPFLALQTLIRKFCNHTTTEPCKKFTDSLTGELLYKEMRATSYDDKEIGDSFAFAPGQNSAAPNYQIFMFANGSWNRIGYFNASVSGAPSNFTVSVSPRNTTIPLWKDIKKWVGNCYPNCGVRSFKQRVSQTQCCWTCSENCTAFSVVKRVGGNFQCVKCASRYAPNPASNYTECREVLPNALILLSTVGLKVLIVLESLGCGLCVVSGLLILVNYRTPFVRGATGDLLPLTSFSLFLLYGSGVFALPSAFNSICIAAWCLCGSLLAVCHSVAFVKMLRFVRPQWSMQKVPLRIPNCEPVVNSALWITGTVLVQVLVLMTWLILRMPHVFVKELPESSQYVYVCSATAESGTIVIFVVPFTCLLIALHLSYRGMRSIFAYQVWQARFLFAGNLCLLAIYLVFIPLFLNSSSDTEHKTILLMAILMATASVFWIALVLPVVWLLCFRSNDNNEDYVQRRYIRPITRNYAGALWVMEPISSGRRHQS